MTATARTPWRDGLSGHDPAGLVADPVGTPARRVRAAFAASLAVAAAAAALAAAARLIAPDTGIAIAAAVCGSLGVLLALLQGAVASDRRGRRRFVLIGLLLATVGTSAALLPPIAPVGALLAGIGLVMVTMSAAAWLGEAIPSRPAAGALLLAAAIAGIVVGAMAPTTAAAALLVAGLIAALLGAETIVAPRTPVFVLPGAPRLAGRVPGALAVVAVVAAQLVLLLGPVPGSVVAAALVALAIPAAGGRGSDAAPSGVSGPGTKAYARAVRPFDASATLEPAAAATVTTVDEVRDAIASAQKQGLGVSMHSTGHAAMGHAALQRDMLLRVRMRGAVEVDPERRLVRIPAGASWDDVVPAAAVHDLAVPHGSSGHVGVVGYLTRGGLSAYGRRTGVAANRLESVELLTADGELVTASRSQDPDLFWAVRGGGGGFGVVTAVTVRAFRPGEVVTGTTAWELEDASAVADAWARWTATAPRAITTSLRILEIPPLPGMPFALSRRPLLVIDGTAVDDDVTARAAAAELLGALRAAARPVLDTWRAAGQQEVPNTHMDPPFSPAHSSAHVLLGEADWRDAEQARSIVAAFIDAAGRRGTGVGIAELRQLGGALAEPASDGGAVSHYRGAFGWLAIALHGKRGADAAAASVDRQQAAILPWATGYTAPTLAVERARPAKSFPVATAERVEAIRGRIDPTGVFRTDVAAGALVR